MENQETKLKAGIAIILAFLLSLIFLMLCVM
jgi:hypothetical protein